MKRRVMLTKLLPYTKVGHYSATVAYKHSGFLSLKLD